MKISTAILLTCIYDPAWGIEVTPSAHLSRDYFWGSIVRTTTASVQQFTIFNDVG